MNFPAGLTDTERALMVVAYAVRRHGNAYVPLLDRLEAEVERERVAGTQQDRAARILRRFTHEVANAVR